MWLPDVGPVWHCQHRLSLRNAPPRYGEPLCQSLTIDHVDRAIIEDFLQVIEPAQMEAALALAEDLERDRIAVERQWQLRLERARYEVERAFRQYDLCEPENRLAAHELERRWNEQLPAVTELDVEYRREQDRGLVPVTEDEKDTLRQLVGNVRVLWEAAEMPMEDRKRLVRCLIREVVLQKDDQPRGSDGVTTNRIGWCSGAWSELRARRPSGAELASTPQPVLERIRDLAQRHRDDQVAAILNAEELRTCTGLSWTDLRVGTVRFRHGIPTACPVVPKGPGPRGDGLVPVGMVMAQMGVSRSVIGTWCRCGFLSADQKAALALRWIRLTDEDRARLDGTRAVQGYGRWRLREAQQMLGLNEEEVYQRVRAGELIAYRAHIGDHWEWRVDLADQTQHDVPFQPVGVHAPLEEV